MEINKKNKYKLLMERIIAPSIVIELKELKYYAGIGSRNLGVLEKKIEKIFISLGYYLALEGYILRSGGAPGCDEFFERGADLAYLKTNKKNKQIFLPWYKFNNNPSTFFNVSPLALEYARKNHQYYFKLKESMKKLMGRNSYQVLGYHLNNPSKFIVCYTPDGCKSGLTRTKETGGTGQAISLAYAENIPIFNIANKNDYEKIINKLKKYKEKYGEVPDFNILKDIKEYLDLDKKEDIVYNNKSGFISKIQKKGAV